MDWQSVITALPYHVASWWRHPLSLEQVPDLVAWCVCGGLAFWIIRRSFSLRPRFFIGSSLTWLCWFAYQVSKNPQEAWSGLKSRGMTALEATEQFFLQGVLLLKAWIDFFLPFLSSIGGWAVRVWKSLSREEQLLVIGSAIGVYVACQVLLLARRWVSRKTQVVCTSVDRRWRWLIGQTGRIVSIIFQLSIFIAAPLMWFAWDYVPPEHFPMLTAVAITYLPALSSTHAIASTSMPPNHRNLKRQRGWLSYWACWPALVLLECCKDYFGHTTDVNKVLLTFVIWLQFWEGSEYFSAILQRLSQTTLLEHVARFFGQSGLQILDVMRRGIGATGAMNLIAGNWKIFRILGFVSRLGSYAKKLGIIAIVVFAVGCLFVLWRAISAFYQAVSVVTWFVTVVIYALAANESANTLRKKREDDYTKKLSFWVMACVWEVITLLCDMVPAIGGVPRLLTPLSHAMWLLAGDWVLRQVVLPLLRKVLAPARILLSWLRAAGRSSAVGDAASTRLPSINFQPKSNTNVVGDIDAVTTPRSSPPGDTGSEHRQEIEVIDDSSNDVTGDTGGEPRPRNSASGDMKLPQEPQEEVVLTGSDTGGTGVPVNPGEEGESSKSELRARKKGKSK